MFKDLESFYAAGWAERCGQQDGLAWVKPTLEAWTVQQDSAIG